MKWIKNLQKRISVTVDLFRDNRDNYVVVKKPTRGSPEVALEVEMLKMAGSHKNIIAPLHMSADEIVLPYCRGGDLLDYVRHTGPLPEPLAKLVTYAMLDALCHLRQKSIVHRDIKLENILITEQHFSGNNVILIDFGHAVSLHHPSPSFIKPVTLPYTAPEVFEGCLYCASDMWSLGVTISTAMLGDFSFDPNGQGAKDEIRTGLPSLRKALDDNDKNLSSEVISLLASMLAMDPRERITPEDAMNHKWFHCATGGYNFCH